MPPILSKPCAIAQEILSQDFVICGILYDFRKEIHNTQCFLKVRKWKKYSYEHVGLMHHIYTQFRLVLSDRKAKCLSEFFLKGNYPSEQQLRWLCDHYQAMYKTLDI